MRKIINHKSYDTDTAKRIGCTAHHLSNNLYCWGEDLYQKRTGEFFLHCWGGAGSKYHTVYSSTEWGWGEQIQPLSYDDANDWAEKNLDADEYESCFGVAPEGATDKVRVNMWLSAACDKAIRQAAAKAGLTISAYIEQQLGNAE